LARIDEFSAIPSSSPPERYSDGLPVEQLPSVSRPEAFFGQVRERVAA
jgi:hypothetical protein